MVFECWRQKAKTCLHYNSVRKINVMYKLETTTTSNVGAPEQKHIRTCG